MTLYEAISLCDQGKPNQYSREEKLRWLSDVDGQIQREILDYVEPGEFAGYDGDTPGDTVLLAPAPYEGVYEAYLSAQIDLHNGEFTRYQNSAQLYNSVFAAFAGWYRREHMPLQENLISLG